MLIQMFKPFYNLLIIGFVLTVISCNPKPKIDDALKQNQKGIDYMNAGKHELAIHEFMEAIKNQALPAADRGTIYRNIALAYHDLDKKDSSQHYYTVAAKSFKKNSYDYLVNTASVDLINGRTDIALSKLLKALAMSADNLSVNNTLGLIYLGDYGQEFTDAKKALQYNKKAFEINGSKITEDIPGRNYYDLENYKLAEMHFENIHNRYPDERPYTLAMGMIKYKLNKQTEGDILFNTLMKQDSSYKEAIDNFKLNNQ